MAIKQPIKGQGKLKRPKPKKPKKKWTPFTSTNTSGQQYGTSQLERDFARDFLDKNGIRYIYQYEAKDIKRFFDFAVTCDRKTNYITEEKDGITCIKQDGQYVDIDLIIEIDGSYYHADPRVVGDKKLNSMQKHSKFVDALKDRWCMARCVTILRFWEYDIRHHPKKVLEELSKYINISNEKRRILENKKRPH